MAVRVLLVSGSRKQPNHTKTSVVSARQSLATARAFQLSAYDVVYLDLARSQRLTLATLDDRLRAAATPAGVSLLR
jgi:predicted nucleic acid-binding protein